MKKDKYKMEYTFSSRDDMQEMKKHILDAFKFVNLEKILQKDEGSCGRIKNITDRL